MLRKKVVSLSVAILIFLNLCVIIPVVALSNKNADLSVSLSIKDNKSFYTVGDKVQVELNLDNYNENSKGIVGFQYDLTFSNQIFDSVTFDKSQAKINSGDSYQIVENGNNSLTGLYVSSIEKPSQLNNINTENDDKGSYYVLPKDNKTIATFTLSIKNDISSEQLEKNLVEDDYSLVFEDRDEESTINVDFNTDKINIINTIPTLTVNGKEYNNSTDLGIIDTDVTISSNRVDDVITVYKDDKVVNDKTILSENGNYKVVLKDVAGKEITVTFTIDKIELQSISIESQPNKLNYYVGDDIDLTGATIVENYSNGTKSQPIEVTKDMVDIKSFDKAGQQEVVVTYKDLKTSFFVTVDEKIITTLDRIEASTKLECIYQTQELSNSDFEVIGYYSDGTSSQIYGFEIDDSYKNVEVGQDATVLISYNGKTDTVVLPVKEREIVGIEIAKNPDKLDYVEKSNQELDLTGGQIKVNYNVGDSSLLDMTDENIEVRGFNPTKIGSQDITVDYKGNTTTFKVNVSEKQVVSIVATQPTKTDYYIGQELDLSGVVVTATYNNDETKVIDIKDCDVSSIDNTTVSEKEIVITYKSKITSITVNYKDLEISKVELVGTPKTEYVEGSNFDTEGLSLKVYYKEVSKTDLITITSDMYEAPDMSTIGVKNVVINYKGFSVNYDIKVKSKSLIDVVFEGKLEKVEYLQGQSIDLVGIKVIAKYDNNTQEDVTDKVSVEFDNMNVSQNAKVKVSYDKYSKEYTVSVLSKENVDLFNQKVNQIISKPITVSRDFYNELLSFKQEVENDISSMSALELQEVKDSYENFKNYFEEVENKVLPTIENYKLNDNLYISVEGGKLYFDEAIDVYEIKTSQKQEQAIKEKYGNNSKVAYHFKSDVSLKEREIIEATYKYNLNNPNVKVAMFTKDGLQEIASVYENNQVVFSGDINSEYVLVDVSTSTVVDNNSNDTQISQNNSQNNNSQQIQNDTQMAKTGDNTNIKMIASVIIVIMVVAIVGLVVLVIIKKRK